MDVPVADGRDMKSMSDRLPSGGVNLLEALHAATAWLEDAGLDTPRLDAEMLLAATLGVERGQIDESIRVPSEVIGVLEERLGRRVAREPIPYILGHCEFRGVRLIMDRRVVVPHEGRTGLLVDLALELPSQQRVLDACTGSGAVALAVKAQRPDLDVRGSDVSPAALQVARTNAQRLGLEVEFLLARDVPPGEYDLVVAAPPYADESSRLVVATPEAAWHQPHIAVYGGDDGLEVIRGLIRSARIGTRIALEHAPGQAEAVRRMLNYARTLRDPDGEERVSVGEVKS